MKVLHKFMAMAIKIVFENKAVQMLSKGPLKACQVAMAVLTENPRPVMKPVIRGIKRLGKYMGSKISAAGKVFDIQGIIKKITEAFDFVIEKIQKALKPILDPIKKAISKMLEPLVKPLLKALEFPPLPKKPKQPGFMVRKKGVNPFSLYHTCAYNLDWVKANGYNQCVCCIMGTMNPRYTIKSLMMYAFKENLCRLM